MDRQDYSHAACRSRMKESRYNPEEINQNFSFRNISIQSEVDFILLKFWKEKTTCK